MPTAREVYEALRVLSRTLSGYRAGLTPAGDEWLKVSDLLGRLDDAMAMLGRSHGLPGPYEQEEP